MHGSAGSAIEGQRIGGDWVRLHPRDNCVVTIKPCPAGARLRLGPDAEVAVPEAVPPGHKIASATIEPGEPVVKYGWPIGVATQAIRPGEWIHSHNLRNDHHIDLAAWQPEASGLAASQAGGALRFAGYRRPGGAVGTRNYVAVISTVNCSASVARWSAARFDPAKLAGFPNVDGVIALRHESGCGMAYEGSKHRMLERTLAGIADHPNVGGAILVGLGCEQATVDHLRHHPQLISIAPPSARSGSAKASADDPLPMITVQAAGGSAAAIAQIEAAVDRLLPQMNDARREEVDISQLVLGLKCGGSDGYSGITANPVLGLVSDRIVAAGGTTILGETTEVFGAEHLLARRAATPQVAALLQEKLEWWHWYAGLFGEQFDHNPSTGNKTGGLTTIAEKSLGAVSKAGSAPLAAVVDYAVPVPRGGLVLMDSPGYDPACVTGMMASGANVIAFTTGRGSCFGSKPAPTIKITTNSRLYRAMPDDMDFDCGGVLAGEPIGEVAEALLAEILEVASGKKTKSELLGYGDDEFIPWTVGPML